MGHAKAFPLHWSPALTAAVTAVLPPTCYATWVRLGTANHGFLFFFWNTFNSCKGQFWVAAHTGLDPWIQISTVSRALGLSSTPQNLSARKQLHSFRFKIGVIDFQCPPCLCSGNLTFGSPPSLGASFLRAGAGGITTPRVPLTSQSRVLRSTKEIKEGERFQRGQGLGS